MARIEIGIALIVLVAEIAALVNCILTPESRVRGMPKALWILLILILPAIGAALWFGVGKTPAPTVVRRSAPDDDPAFLGRVEPARSRQAQLEQDERIRRLEAELAALESETDGDGDPGRRRG